MPSSATSSISESSHGSSVVQSDLHRQDKGNQDDSRDQEDDGLGKSHGLFGAIFGATYLAQTPHEQALSVKKGMASSLIQALQLLFLLLSPYAGIFAPDTNLWVYKYFSWVLIKIPILQLKSYTVYIGAVYTLLVALLAVVALIVWMSKAIKNDEHERRKYKRLLSLVRPASGLLFLVFPIAILDLCSGVFTCSWQDWPNPVPLLWPERGSCVAGPHLIHATLAAVTFLLYAVVHVLMGVGTCEQNPASIHMSSTPNLGARLRITVIKVLLVLFTSQLVSTSQHTWQAGLCLWLTLWAFWINLQQAPFYRPQTNSLHCGLWLGCAYLSALGIAGAVLVGKGQNAETVKLMMTWWAGVLIMPVGFFGIFLSRLRILLIKRDLQRIADAHIGAKPHQVIRLQGRWHVELLSRCVRDKYNAKTGAFDQDSLDLAETVLAYGFAKYGKNDPFMVTLQASFSIFIHKDVRQARMQLDAASREHGSALQSYRQFCCGEYIKAMKDNANAGMDLASFVEFSKNYRGAVRAHRAALQAQRSFWRVLLKEHVKFSELEDAIEDIKEAEKKAVQIYRRVTERYPENAKLLKVYGRFVEDVMHDPWKANKLYTDAARKGSSDGNMNLGSLLKSLHNNSSDMIDLDEQSTGIVIINTAGIIMTTNPAFCALFGYTRTQMEGHNISMIVPPPFSQRHDSYIDRYVVTGKARLIGSTRRVIGMHKDRYMVPCSVTVSKLSGSGSDMVFLGVAQPITPEAGCLEVWGAPYTGSVLCVDPRFQDFFGYVSGEVTGKPLSALLQQPEALDKVVADTSAAMCAQLLATSNPGIADGSVGSSHSTTALMQHKYLGMLEVQVTVEPAGTATMPWLVFKLEPKKPAQPLAVLDQRLSIVAASGSFASLLGYSQEQVMGLNMSDILPLPWSQLHQSWVKDMRAKPPAYSCRSGLSVSMLTKSNSQLSVKIQVSSKDELEGTRHVLQVAHIDKQTGIRQRGHSQQRLLLSVDRTSGCIVEAADGSQAVFCWEPSLLAGQPLTAVVDVFDMWEASKGAGSATMLLHNLSLRAQGRPGESWRVGVKPIKSGDAEQDNAATAQGWNKVLKSFQAAKGKAGVMPARLQVLTEAIDEPGWNTASLVTVALWRDDALSGILEIDSAMRILKVDDMSSLILGAGSTAILRHSLLKYLPDIPLGSELLGYAQKGMLKKQGGAWTVGQLQKLQGVHRDGLPSTVTVQAVGKVGQQAKRMFVHIRSVNPTAACIEAFQNIEQELAAADSEHGNDGSSLRSGATAAAAHLHGARSSIPQTQSTLAAQIIVAQASTVGRGSVKLSQPRGSVGSVSHAVNDAEGLVAAVAAAVIDKGSRGPHCAPDYEGPITDDMAADLAAELSSGNASQHSYSSHGSHGANCHDHHHHQQQQQQNSRIPAQQSPKNRVSVGSASAARSSPAPCAAATRETPRQATRVRLSAQIVTPMSPRGRAVGAHDGTASGSLHSSEQSGSECADATVLLGDGPRLPGKEAAVQSYPTHAEDARYRSQARLAATGEAGTGFFLSTEEDAMASVSVIRKSRSLESPKRSPVKAGFGGGSRNGENRNAGKTEDDDNDGASSCGDSASEGDAASSVADHEQEAQADARRAKRLKRLLRLLGSDAAQETHTRFRQRTWWIIAGLLVVHLGCYVLFKQEIESQRIYIDEVDVMAHTVDQASLMVAQSYILSECLQPEWHDSVRWCAPSNMRGRIYRGLQNAVHHMRDGHHGIFLGLKGVVRPLDSLSLHSLWHMPTSTESLFLNTAQPKVIRSNQSLWYIGNAMVQAGAQLLSDATPYVLSENNVTMWPEIKQSRHYHYVQDQGMGIVYDQYTRSLDRMVTRAYNRLGGVGTVLTVLMVMEAFGITLGLVVYNWVLVHNMARHHMIMFTAFLAVPSALIRSMATKPCVVDDEDDVSEDDDDHDEIAQLLENGRKSVTGERSSLAGKQVRMAAPEDDSKTYTAPGKKSLRKSISESGRQGEQCKSCFRKRVSSCARCCDLAAGDSLQPMITNCTNRPLAAVCYLDSGAMCVECVFGCECSVCNNYAMLPAAGLKSFWAGIRRVAGSSGHKAYKVNGKRLIPSISMESKSMVTFILFQLLLVLIYTISFDRLSGLEGPLSQLNTVEHVMYRASRARTFAVKLVFSKTAEEKAKWRANLNRSCDKLSEEFNVLMYGGTLEWISTSIRSEFLMHSPSMVFSNRATADTLFTTHDCLRADKSSCFQPGDEYYKITHSGLAAMISRYIEECRALQLDADADAHPNSHRYAYMYLVAGRDMNDGIQALGQSITQATIDAYEDMTKLHLVLLLLAIALLVGYLVIIFRPMLVQTREHVDKVAGLLSQLPAEVDVESRLRTALNHNRRSNTFTDEAQFPAEADTGNTAQGAVLLEPTKIWVMSNGGGGSYC